MQAYQEELSDILSKKKIKVFSNAVDKPGIMVKNHWHDSYEILYVIEGFGEQRINSQKFGFAPGAVIVICPGDIHSTVATSECGCVIEVLQFVEEYFGPRERLLIDLISSVTETTGKDIFDLFDSIKSHASEEKKSDELILSGAVYMLLGKLMQGCQNSTVTAKMTAFAKSVCLYLRTHDDIRLDLVSRHFAYSPEHFSRKFHSDLGISYKDYCEKIRMQHFLKALEDDSISLSEIAERLGYSDKSSFIRAFKRIYGMTPGTYRRLKNNFN